MQHVANTKPLRWLMKPLVAVMTCHPALRRKYQAFTMADETHYPFKHLIILHAPPSLREPLRTAGQGMPNSL